MQHVVCYSGGHSSAIAAIETVRKHGKKNVILLNHDISEKVEHKDIKRFKQDVADYLDIGITYANMDGWENETPISVSKKIGAFKVGTGTALCTNRLKTEPFQKWLKNRYPVKKGEIRNDVSFAYGFDINEKDRIQRRVGIMATMGYKTAYPLATQKRTIEKTEDIGIKRPSTYKVFKHANCIGCLKAGKQHWYVVYCIRPDIWADAKDAETEIGHSILNNTFLEDLQEEFHDMKYNKMICPNQKTNPATFWAMVEKTFAGQSTLLPCDCAF